MVLLDLYYTHTNYDKDISPFLINGIFIDTSVMKIFIDGYINHFFSSKEDVNYNNLIALLDYLKINSKWQKFLITPHILTEICHHFYCDHNKRNDYPNIVKQIFPILKTIKEEREIIKDDILDFVDINKPIIELGDISIFLCVDKIINTSKKTAILVNDRGFNKRYEYHPKVMIIDYKKTILDLLKV